jgi:hypothetical protein
VLPALVDDGGDFAMIEMPSFAKNDAQIAALRAYLRSLP